MIDKKRRLLIGSVPSVLLLASGCSDWFSQDDTVKVSNKTDDEERITIRFVDRNDEPVVDENELTIGPRGEKQYKVNLEKSGHESSHYAVRVTTGSGLSETHDLGEGVFYILYVNLKDDGLEVYHTTR